MPLENANTIDAAGIEKATGHAILTITDSWDWRDEPAHLAALQDKLNAYLRSVESGEIWSAYPPARGKTVVIDVITRFALPPSALRLLGHASTAAADLGVVVRHQHCPSPTAAEQR